MNNYDLDKLFIIAKHIAESDSISECYAYHLDFTKDMFNKGLKGESELGGWGDYVNNAKELYDKLF